MSNRIPAIISLISESGFKHIAKSLIIAMQGAFADNAQKDSDQPFLYAVINIPPQLIDTAEDCIDILGEDLTEFLLPKHVNFNLKENVHHVEYRETKHGVKMVVALTNHVLFNLVAEELTQSIMEGNNNRTKVSFPLPLSLNIPGAIPHLKSMENVANILQLCNKTLSFNYYSGGVPDSPTTVTVDFSEKAA